MKKKIQKLSQGGDILGGISKFAPLLNMVAPGLGTGIGAVAGLGSSYLNNQEMKQKQAEMAMNNPANYSNQNAFGYAQGGPVLPARDNTSVPNPILRPTWMGNMQNQQHFYAHNSPTQANLNMMNMYGQGAQDLNNQNAAYKKSLTSPSTLGSVMGNTALDALGLFGGNMIKPAVKGVQMGSANKVEDLMPFSNLLRWADDIKVLPKSNIGFKDGGDLSKLAQGAGLVTGAPNQIDGNNMNYKGSPIALNHGETLDTNKDRVISTNYFNPVTGKKIVDEDKALKRSRGKAEKILQNGSDVAAMNTVKYTQQKEDGLYRMQEMIAQMAGDRNRPQDQPPQGYYKGGEIGNEQGVPLNKFYEEMMNSQGRGIQVEQVTNNDTLNQVIVDASNKAAKNIKQNKKSIAHSEDTAKIQRELKALGYDLGNYGNKGVDGIWGKKTESAYNDSVKKGIYYKEGELDLTDEQQGYQAKFKHGNKDTDAFLTGLQNSNALKFDEFNSGNGLLDSMIYGLGANQRKHDEKVQKWYEAHPYEGVPKSSLMSKENSIRKQKVKAAISKKEMIRPDDSSTVIGTPFVTNSTTKKKEPVSAPIKSTPNWENAPLIEAYRNDPDKSSYRNAPKKEEGNSMLWQMLTILKNNEEGKSLRNGRAQDEVTKQVLSKKYVTGGPIDWEKNMQNLGNVNQRYMPDGSEIDPIYGTNPLPLRTPMIPDSIQSMFNPDAGRGDNGAFLNRSNHYITAPLPLGREKGSHALDVRVNPDLASLDTDPYGNALQTALSEQGAGIDTKFAPKQHNPNFWSQSTQGEKIGMAGQAASLIAKGIESFQPLQQQATRLNTAPISLTQLDPSSILNRNQQSYQSALAANQGNTSNQNVGIQQALFANKLSADNQALSQFQQQNASLKDNYEQRLAQRMGENNQSANQTDDIMARRRGTRENMRMGLYGDVATMGMNVGNLMNTRMSNQAGLQMMKGIAPDVWANQMKNMSPAMKQYFGLQ